MNSHRLPTPLGSGKNPNQAWTLVPEYLKRGWAIIPLCWPTSKGTCGCNKRHSERNAGKAPLTPHGVHDATTDLEIILSWQRKWPNANIGIALDPSKLFVIAPDSPTFLEKFMDWGFGEPLMVVQSGGGPGHLHMYYRRSDVCPTARINRSGEYDIMSDGYMVAPGSLHLSGRRYLTDGFIDGNDGIAPQWAVDMLIAASDKTPRTSPTWDQSIATPVNYANLEGETQRWFDGVKTATTPDGRVDRSRTLFILARLLARGGVDGPTIAQTLADRDDALGYRKFSGRKDSGFKDYNKIASIVTGNSDDSVYFQTIQSVQDFQDVALTTQPPLDSEGSPLGISYGQTSELPYRRGRREQGKEDRAFFLHLSALNTHPLNIKMRSRLKCILADARTLGNEKAQKWCDTVEHCVISIKAQFHEAINEISLVPMRCGSKACPPCAWRLIERFFQKRGKLLLEHLSRPVVFQVSGIHFQIRRGDEGIPDIIQHENQVRKALLRLSDYEGGNLGRKTATTFVDSIKPVLNDDILELPVVILANAEPGALQMLQQRMTKEFGVGAQVKIISWGDDLVGAVDVFISESAINFEADGFVNFDRLAQGSKRKKLFQGHGALASITMTRSSAKDEKSGSKPEGCKLCSISHKKIEIMVPISQARSLLKRAANGQVFTAAAEPLNPIYAPGWTLIREAHEARDRLLARNNRPLLSPI